MNLIESLEKLEAIWGKNVGFYGIPPCKNLPNGGYEVNLIPRKEDAYVFGVLRAMKRTIVAETLNEAISKALQFIEKIEETKRLKSKN